MSDFTKSADTLGSNWRPWLRAPFLATSITSKRNNCSSGSQYCAIASEESRGSLLVYFAVLGD